MCRPQVPVKQAAVLIRGSIRGTRQGFAFLAPDDGGEEIYIAAANLGEAIHGDRVEASLVRRYPYDFRPEGVVESILERPNPNFTGDVIRVSRTIFVLPDTPVLPSRIRLKTGRQAVSQGSKVLFRIERSRAGSPLVATLDHILGDAEDPALAQRRVEDPPPQLFEQGAKQEKGVAVSPSDILAEDEDTIVGA